MRVCALVVEGRGYSLVAVRGLLIAVSSPVVECRLWDARASVVEAAGL